jgi:hypothetical protein
MKAIDYQIVLEINALGLREFLQKHLQSVRVALDNGKVRSGRVVSALSQDTDTALEKFFEAKDDEPIQELLTRSQSSCRIYIVVPWKAAGSGRTITRATLWLYATSVAVLTFV